MRTEEEQGPATTPKQLGRYEIVTELGKGGMARVYLAIQRGPFGATKLVVVKQLRPEVADNELFVAQFVDEARIALRLNHPNVVHTYDVIVTPPHHFMAMEFLEGLSLSSILRRVGYEKISLELHAWILAQVLAGLHYAHELHDFDGMPLRIVHRDVSPSNVFVTYTGEVKLLDFGIAKATNALSSTVNGVIKGKIGYAAPEQLVGGQVDARTDVYSVGIMLWEAMARRRRWSGGTYLAKLHARIEQDAPSIEEIWPEVPPQLATTCRRALATEIEERHASALELGRELDAYFGFSSRGIGVQSLREFMSAHFRDDSVALQQKISSAIDPVALPPRSESADPAPLKGQEMEKRTMPLSRLHKVALAVTAALVLVAVGIAGSGWRARSPRDVEGIASSPHGAAERGPPAASEMAASDWTMAALDAQSAAVEPSGAPAADTPTAIAEHAPSVGSAPRGVASVPRRKQERAFGQPPSSTETVSREDRSRVPDRVEPGMDLRARGTAHVKHALDERDPYTP